MAALFTIAACCAHAEGAAQNSQTRVQDYRPVFQECRKAGAARHLAIRHMEIDGHGMLLTVDPATLATSLERDQDWSCADTSNARQQDTRYIRAMHGATTPAQAAPIIANGGLLRGTKTGSFVTGDLCPSRRPLDRAFLERLQTFQSPLPLALSISGLWLTRHQADFQWLLERQRSGALQITWVDHSYHHPYSPGRPLADNFLLAPGVDMRAEMLDTEKLLIEKGQTPSVFFRFPGLISTPALMQMAAEYHLIVLGAGAWLARAPRARPGDIILVHVNGNEPAGLHIFSTLLDGGKLPQPFRPINDAP